VTGADAAFGANGTVREEDTHLTSEHRTAAGGSWLAVVICTLLFAGCEEPQQGDGSCEIAGLEATLSEAIPTVGEVTFEASCEGVEQAYVEIEAADGSSSVVPAEEGAEDSWSARLLGLTASTEYTVVAAVVVDGGTLSSERRALTTGGVPVELPDLAVEAIDPASTSGGLLVTTVVSVPSAAVVFDHEGRYVWWTIEEDESWVIRRVRLSRDGEWIIYLVQKLGMGLQSDLLGRIRWVRLDGSEILETDLLGTHHDFVELPDGTIGVIQAEREVVGTTLIIGDRIVEIEPDGDVVEVWSLFDEVELDEENAASIPDFNTHANALDYDEETGHYYISVRNLNTLYKIDRAAGEVVWRFGGVYSDFELLQGTPIQGEHQFDVLPGGLLVFDNREDPVEGSRVVEFALDEGEGTAEQTWEYFTEPRVYCYVLGDVTRRVDGNTFVTWSTAGQFEELDPAGELVWSANLELGAGLGYTSHLETLYR